MAPLDNGNDTAVDSLFEAREVSFVELFGASLQNLNFLSPESVESFWEYLGVFDLNEIDIADEKLTPRNLQILLRVLIENQVRALVPLNTLVRMNILLRDNSFLTAALDFRRVCTNFYLGMAIVRQYRERFAEMAQLLDEDIQAQWANVDAIAKESRDPRNPSFSLGQYFSTVKQYFPSLLPEGKQQKTTLPTPFDEALSSASDIPSRLAEAWDEA